MKKIYIFIIFIITLHISAQTPRDPKSLTENELNLYDYMLVQDNIRETRVKIYLSNNPEEKKIVVKDDVVYVLYDIINGNPIYRTLDNQTASRATKTNTLQPGGSLGLNLKGTNMFVAVWDGGPVQFDHVEFLNPQNIPNRVSNFEFTNTDGTSNLSNHANHVIGTIAARGVLPEARGMATDVNIINYNFNNDNPEMVAVQNSFVDINLSNHSYGVPVIGTNGPLPSWIMGAYTQDARNIDQIAATYPFYLIVSSAGNSGNSQYSGGLFPGFDKLTYDKVAKNNLVVANANAFFNGSNQLSYPINSSSSQGPTDDLRIKPDIAGDGTNLTSPVTNSAYDTYSGTSMSAPNLTGSLLLLQEYYNQVNGNFMKAATLKALVCHTALDDVQFFGPDPYFGWGLLDSEFAAQTIFKSSIGTATIEERTLNNGDNYSFTFSASSGGKISATICWTDVPGIAVNNDLNNNQPRLINDLDIRITKDDTTFMPWFLILDQTFGFMASKGDNFRDNVEKIDIEVPTAGVYTVTISHKGNLQSFNTGNQSQDYSLILTGDNLTLSTTDLSTLDVRIWPNPSNGILNVKFIPVGDTTKINLFDMQGREVYSKRVDSNSSNFNYSINTSEFAEGIYLLKIENGNIQHNEKIILKK